MAEILRIDVTDNHVGVNEGGILVVPKEKLIDLLFLKGEVMEDMNNVTFPDPDLSRCLYHVKTVFGFS